MIKKLNRANAGVSISRPIKVLQFGEGNFLRAFVDWIIDILNEKSDFNGAIQIIQPIQQGMINLINDQNGLYHVILNGLMNGKKVNETRLITSVAGAMSPYQDFNKFLQLAENPDLQFIVSNTTEAGISFDAKDLSPTQLPNSFPGKLTALLYHRFLFFKGDPKKSLIIMPCELIDRNGSALKATILQYIKQWQLSQDFNNWIETHTTFCNTLVDRIVPGFPKENISEIHNQLGYSDNLVVTAEPFLLWVIEAPQKVRAQFPAEKTNLQIKFVSDLSAYRTRKVRILNGAHTAMVPVAYLMGFRTVRESIEDKVIGDYIRRVIYNEVIPTLDLPDEELKQFADDVLERFQNPYIKHELISIALNSISKFKTRVLPSILEYASRKHQLPPNLVFSLAALIRFYKGDFNGVNIPLQDSPDVLDFFGAVWGKESLTEISNLVLGNESFWGLNLNKISGLHESVTQYLKLIHEGKWKIPL